MRTLNDYLRKKFSLLDIRIGQRIEWELLNHLRSENITVRESVGIIQFKTHSRLIGQTKCYQTFWLCDDQWIYFGFCPAGECVAPEVDLPLLEIEKTISRLDQYFNATSTNKRWMNDLSLKTSVHCSLEFLQNYNNFTQNLNLRQNE